MVYLEGGPERITYEIWTVNPDGTDPRPLDGSDVRQVEGMVVVPPYERASSWNPVVRP